MEKNKVLEYVLKEASDRVDEFFNLYELPSLPKYEEILEDIALNMPYVSSEIYTQVINAAVVLMMKKTIDFVNMKDSGALKEAFNALSSTNINTTKKDEIDEILSDIENDSGESE